MLISEVVRATGIASSALRFYERQGLIEPAGRRNGQRCYDPSIFERLAFVDLCQRAGLTVREIGAVLHQDEDYGWRAVARRRLDELEEQLQSLEQARTALQHLMYCRHRSVASCPIVRSSLRNFASDPS
ncbi:MAG: MerR family transcriptional regulator [Actinobacteria bacterium]|nr:MerR family transcriptional regulator [Actinomycetota bacterium]